MTAKLDYRWKLREVMATRGMFSTISLQPPLAERGIDLSSSQVYRLVTERPERLSLKVLMALLDILDCSMDDLIEPVASASSAAKPKRQSATPTPASGRFAPSGPGSSPGQSRDPARPGPH
jgi:DNA-binding Xre family transcriptional regulator